eukprot:6585726-Prymnesium_polylepis.1
MYACDVPDAHAWMRHTSICACVLAVRTARGRGSAPPSGHSAHAPKAVCVCVLRVYGAAVCVCYGPTGRGTRTGHASGTRNRHGGATRGR